MLPSGRGSYNVRMIPYQDADFRFPLIPNPEGTIDIEIDDRFYLEVQTEGVDPHQISTVLDSCWATPVNNPNHAVRRDLVISECPNLAEGTVELIQNGVSTVARFSFQIFTFTNSEEIYLYCNIHLCLLRTNSSRAQCYPGHKRRFQRDASYHDSAAISLGPLVLSPESTGTEIQRNRASGQ